MNDPCNGCGVCCASAPCPLGAIVSRRTRGACSALVWAEDRSLYRCGLIERPAEHLPRALRGLAPMLAMIARRYIASGVGCDCNLSVVDQSAADDSGEGASRQRARRSNQ